MLARALSMRPTKEFHDDVPGQTQKGRPVPATGSVTAANPGA